jgi:outer membrane protein OmpA-like peptidoglycan-associated protein
MRTLILATLTAASFAACATANPPQELVDARASYKDAEQGAAPKYKPDQLHEARLALDEAEQSFKDDPNSEKTKNLSYVARRRAQLAESEGETARALENKNEATSQVSKVQANQLASTRAELGAVKGDLSKTQEQLTAEQQAHAAAEARAKDALDKLALASVPVKQETRGMVITLPGSVLFASGKSTLLSSAQDKLSQVADALKDQEDHKITVEGYTDSRGSDESNQLLSQQRADSVRDYLVTRGVPGDQIEARGFGPSRPVASNKTAEGRADNRRVEIVVKPVEPK